MNVKGPFFILVFFLSASVFSQANWFHYAWTLENSRDNERICDETHRFDSIYYKDNRYISLNCDRFCSETGIYLFDDLNEGNIYKSFDGMEEYVRKVLDKVVPDKLLTKNIKIVFYRDESVNASMSESGLLRLNIGMMAKLGNEAELAMLLGHEVAHFFNEDVAKSYARLYEKKSAWSQNPDWDYEVKGSWAWGYQVTAKRNEWYSREQEESADITSIEFIRKSSYSLKSAANLFRLLKREEIRDQIKYGKGESNLRTHQDPGKRMQLIKEFSQESLDPGKKNYLVDSVQFTVLKEKCFMELVNICLTDNSLEKLMTISFSKYLLEPGNESNLSVLIEAIRRFIFLNRETKDYNKSFILHQYQSKRPESLKNFPFLSEETPCILDFLSKGFLDIWKEDLPLIKARDLADPEVTEFTTYYGAYEYFKRKATENEFRMAEHYKYFGTGADWKDVDSYQKINTVFLSNDYLSKRKTDSLDKKILLIMPFSAEALSKIFDPKDIRVRTAQFNKQLRLEIKNAQSPGRIKVVEFSFKDQHQIRGMIHTCRSTLKVKPEQESLVTSNFNWTEACPEACSLFAKNGTSDLYICFPHIYSTVPTEGPKIVIIFYKISLPSAGKNANTVVRMQTHFGIGELKNEEKFLKRLNKEMDYFLTTAQKE